MKPVVSLEFSPRFERFFSRLAERVCKLLDLTSNSWWRPNQVSLRFVLLLYEICFFGANFDFNWDHCFGGHLLCDPVGRFQLFDR